MDGEYALDPFAVRYLADGEALLQAAAAAGDADAFVGLDAAALAFGDLDVDDDRVAGGEIGDFADGAELGDLFGLQRLDDVHFRLHAVTPVRYRAVRRALRRAVFI